MLRNFLLAGACLFHCLSIAQSQSWTYGQTTDKTARWATTINDSKGILTQRCVPEEEQCYWSIAISTGCEKDASFPILASTDSGATHLTVFCGRNFAYNGETYYQYFFNFDAVDKLIRGGQSIGFAMALQSGQFRVVRFDLTSAVQAIDSMRALTTADIDRKPKKKTKDQVL